MFYDWFPALRDPFCFSHQGNPKALISFPHTWMPCCCKTNLPAGRNKWKWTWSCQSVAIVWTDNKVLDISGLAPVGLQQMKAGHRPPEETELVFFVSLCTCLCSVVSLSRACPSQHFELQEPLHCEALIRSDFQPLCPRPRVHRESVQYRAGMSGASAEDLDCDLFIQFVHTELWRRRCYRFCLEAVDPKPTKIQREGFQSKILLSVLLKSQTLVSEARTHPLCHWVCEDSIIKHWQRDGGKAINAK